MREVGLDRLQHLVCLQGVEVFMRTSLDAVLLQLKVAVRGDAVPCERASDAHQRTAIQGHDRSSRTSDPEQLRDIPADACNAGHLGDVSTVQLQCNVVRQLRGTGAAGT